MSTPERTHPWRDDEFVRVGRHRYSYQTFRGEVISVHLPGRPSLSWDTFRRHHPDARLPQRVRS